MSVFWTLIAILASLLLYVYVRMKKKYKYWEEQGVTYTKPTFLFGNFFPVLTLQKTINKFYEDYYENFPNEKVVGAYECVEPVLIIRDPVLMEKILVKDFQHFTDHPRFGNEDGLFSQGLFNLRGKFWRSVRYKISPTFTTGKLKAMFPTMEECGNQLITQLNKNTKEVKLKNILNLYSLNIVAYAVFGIEFKDEKVAKEFFRNSNRIFNSGIMYFFRQVFITLFPNLSNKLNVRFFPPDLEIFFSDLITATFKNRENSNVVRHDYIDSLIKLKKQGFVDVIDKDTEDNFLQLDSNTETDKIELSENILAGQALQFFIAGFDPPVNNALFTLFELARNPHIQEQARNEIKESLRKHGGYSYAAVKDMVFLEQCIYEALRLYNLVETLQRVCTKTYTTPDGLEIERGTRVMIPIKPMNVDPQFFSNPKKYDPTRFSEDKRVPFVYVPFGTGPRICIGMRYALVQMKVALSKILLNYKVALNSKTKIPLEMHKLTLFPLLKSEILFDFTPIQ